MNTKVNPSTSTEPITNFEKRLEEKQMKQRFDNSNKSLEDKITFYKYKNRKKEFWKNYPPYCNE